MDVLYVDDSLIAVNKPPGVATTPGGWEKEVAETRNLVDLLSGEYGKLWIVHRLDKVTSGVILFARSASMHKELSQLFESHLIKKNYHALVCGVPSWDERTARHRLRQNVGHGHRTVIDHSHGKSAVTHFRVTERFSSNAFIEAVTETGRTHQIRVHASALGYPLLADTLYGASPTGIISRPALHAFSLAFELNGEPFSFTAAYPGDFTDALARLREKI